MKIAISNIGNNYAFLTDSKHNKNFSFKKDSNMKECLLAVVDLIDNRDNCEIVHYSNRKEEDKELFKSLHKRMIAEYRKGQNIKPIIRNKTR